MILPTDAASQEPVVGSAQRVIVARARASRDTAVQHCSSTSALSIRILSSRGALDRSYSSRVYFRKLHLCVAYAPVDLDGQVGILVDVSPEVYKLVRLVVHLTHCLYAECGGGLRHPLRA